MAGEVPIVRSIVAVAAGFFASNVMSLGGDLFYRTMAAEAFDAEGHARSNGALLVIMGYEMLFTVVAGYVTARLAIRRPLLHALVMAGLVTVGRAPTALLTWDAAPAWFHVGVLLMIVPAALAGAKIGAWHTQSREQSPA